MLHPQDGHPFNVLFLCTGNSARSIMAECLLNARGSGRFVGHSAGSHPKGEVNALALELLARMKLPTAGLRSKSWSEFAGQGAPRMDFVITVCDSAAGEACPIWPGHPMTAHWGIADPAAAEEKDKPAAFRAAFSELDSRIRIFTRLPIQSLDRNELMRRLRAIGRKRNGGVE